jgi:hypothetical protein
VPTRRAEESATSVAPRLADRAARRAGDLRASAAARGRRCRPPRGKSRPRSPASELGSPCPRPGAMSLARGCSAHSPLYLGAGGANRLLSSGILAQALPRSDRLAVRDEAPTWIDASHGHLPSFPATRPSCYSAYY